MNRIEKVQKLIELNQYKKQFEYMRVWCVLDILQKNNYNNNNSKNIFIVDFFYLFNETNNDHLYENMVIPEIDYSDSKTMNDHFWEYLRDYNDEPKEVISTEIIDFYRNKYGV